MGFMDKMMGLGGAASDSKKQEIRDIFNAKVENGESYQVLAAMYLLTEKKLLKEVRTYFNYIIGYRDGDDPEMVIITTDHELSVSEEPVLCKKSECLATKYLEKTGSFEITHPGLGGKPFEFGIITSTAWGGYIIAVSYVDEYLPFMEFFRNRFSK